MCPLQSIPVTYTRDRCAYVVDLTLVTVESTAFGRQGPEVQSQSREPDQTDVDRVFADFVPMQLECLRNYTTLLPHVAEMTQAFQKEDIKIGSTTGFVRSMVDILEADAKEQSYVPDASVAGDEVENGARPQPFMVYRNLDLMVVHPIQSIVKVGDTVSGVGEALEAGCWGGVGIARYSNYMDIDSLDQAENLPECEIQRRLTETREILQKAGAHYVIDTFD